MIRHKGIVLGHQDEKFVDAAGTSKNSFIRDLSDFCCCGPQEKMQFQVAISFTMGSSKQVENDMKWFVRSFLLLPLSDWRWDKFENQDWQNINWIHYLNLKFCYLKYFLKIFNANLRHVTFKKTIWHSWLHFSSPQLELKCFWVVFSLEDRMWLDKSQTKRAKFSPPKAKWWPPQFRSLVWKLKLFSDCFVSRYEFMNSSWQKHDLSCIELDCIEPRKYFHEQFFWSKDFFSEINFHKNGNK